MGLQLLALGPALRPVLYGSELTSSYVRRLELALDAPPGYLARVARARSLTVAEVAESKTALEPDTLRPDGAFVSELIGRRFVCTACTGGEVVEIEPHFSYFCCLEHGTWVGPQLEPRPVAQRVGAAVLDADVTFRALHDVGDVSLEVLTDAAWIVGCAGGGSRVATRVTATNFTDIVQVLNLLTNSAFRQEVRGQQLDSARQRTIVVSKVAATLPLAATLVSYRLLAVARNLDRLSSATPTADVRRSANARTRHCAANRPTSVRPDNRLKTATSRHAMLTERSLARKRPDLAAQWHPTLNAPVTPRDVTFSSNSQKYWWLCPSCGHEWLATPNNRSKGRGCPVHSGRAAGPANSLEAQRPELASEWDKNTNGDLTPRDVTPGSGRLVNWICPKGHAYRAQVAARTGNGTGCPVCANLAVLPGVNDIASAFPSLASEWAWDLNGVLDPRYVVAGSRVRVHWRCARHDHTWVASVVSRTARRSGCPVCANQVVLAGVNDLGTTHPHVAGFWFPVDGDPTPTSVTAGSGRSMHWSCTNGHPHTFARTVARRCRNDSCPVCTNHQVEPGFNDVATRYPAIAREWHPTLNDTTPDAVLPGNTPRWWICRLGHTTRGTVPNRVRTQGCPRCAPRARVGEPHASGTAGGS